MPRFTHDGPRPSGPGGRLRGLALGLIAGALTIPGPGCSGSGDALPREAVSGTVNLDGSPLARGTISFLPDSGGADAKVGGGGSVEDGRFTIPRENGLVPGRYKVAINASPDTGGAPRPKGRVTKRSELAKDLIPTKYNSKSELSAEIKKGGASDLKFDLQSK